MIINEGEIISGEYVGWQIKLVDDTAGDTGGYYIILFNNKGDGFDHWFEKYDFLENQLSDFDVKWKNKIKCTSLY